MSKQVWQHKRCPPSRKMMINNILEGSYVYIPSSCKIMLFHENSEFVKKTKVLEKPIYVVYLGESDSNKNYGQIFFDGKIWNTYKNNIYPGKENE